VAYRNSVLLEKIILLKNRRLSLLMICICEYSLYFSIRFYHSRFFFILMVCLELIQTQAGLFPLTFMNCDHISCQTLLFRMLLRWRLLSNCIFNLFGLLVKKLVENIIVSILFLIIIFPCSLNISNYVFSHIFDFLKLFPHQ
jgi:uncharacterized membrane protein YcfT